jgi:hypothetical protein
MSETEIILGGLQEAKVQIERRVGNIDARVDGIERRLIAQDTVLADHTKVLQEIHDGLFLAKGVFKWAIKVGAGSALVGTAFSKGWDWFKGHL